LNRVGLRRFGRLAAVVTALLLLAGCVSKPSLKPVTSDETKGSPKEVTSGAVLEQVPKSQSTTPVAPKSQPSTTQATPPAYTTNTPARVLFSAASNMVPGRLQTAAEISTEDVVQTALATTVFIQTDKGLGSGFFLDAQGTVATNSHVIAGASQIAIMTQDQKVHRVLEIAVDRPDMDVAVLKTEAQGYPVIKMLEARPRHGARVYAVGNPFGLDWTVSDGIIANPARMLDQGGMSYIQHTAPISPGNSGGPLITEAGEIVGMNTMTITLEHAQNINISVSAGDVLGVWRASTPQPQKSGKANAQPTPAPATPGPVAASPGTTTPFSQPPLSAEDLARVQKDVTIAVNEVIPAVAKCFEAAPTKDLWENRQYDEGKRRSDETASCLLRAKGPVPLMGPEPVRKLNDSLYMGLWTYYRAFGYLYDAFNYAGAQKPKIAEAFLDEYMAQAAIATKYLEAADGELRVLLNQ
jgi:S1-C subfamily serine protease